MPIYQAPIRDYQFILSELLNIYQYQELDIFNLYDGEITDTDYLDSDWVDDEIQSIYEK